MTADEILATATIEARALGNNQLAKMLLLWNEQLISQLHEDESAACCTSLLAVIALVTEASKRLAWLHERN